MKKTLSAYIDRFRHDRNYKVRLWIVLFILAIIVAFFVSWELHNVGIAMTGDGEENVLSTEEDTELLVASGTESGSLSLTSTSEDGSNSGISLASEEGSETEDDNSGIATVAEEVEETVELVAVDVADVIDSLDGNSYVITGNSRTRAMQATASGSSMASVVVADTDISDLTQWTFTSDGNGYYYLSSGSSYLQMSASTSNDGILVLVDSESDATAFTVYAYEKNSVTYLVITATVGGYTYYINKSGGESSTNGFVAYYNSPENGGANSQLLLYSVETTSTSTGYQSVDEFYLWIYNGTTNTLPKVAGYSEFDTDSGNNFSSTGIKDALTYTDSDNTTYYLIPVSYFTNALASYGYTFDESNIASCPLIYAPNAGENLSTTTNIKTCLFASYIQVDGTWYVQVTDTTTGYTVPRSNIYYTEYMLELYEDDAYATMVKQEYITDYIGIGSRQILIPVSYFSNYFLSSDIEAAYTGGSLTASSTITICGTEYTTYTSGTYTFTYRPAYWQSGTQNASYVKYNDTWYLLVQDTGNGYSLPVRNKIRYTGSVTRGAVLNLSNGNGTYNFTIYGSTKLRYTVALGDYADDNGNVTINLPSDNDLSTTFTVATNSDGSATVALGEESAYDYKLVGWYNIATGEYYDVSGGSTTATINLDDDNVFYADWIANSYDQVDTTNLTNVIETADTSSFVTIKMFDFGELFNLYSASLEQNGLTSETWTDSGLFYSEPLLANTGLTALADTSFVFFNTDAPTNATGNLSLLKNRTNYAWNKWTGSGAGPYTGLYNEDIIKMLYSTDNSTSSTLGSYYVGEANYLFSYDASTSIYSYDASKNAAVYQQSDSRFYVYNAPQMYSSSGGGTGSIFLPFNSYSSSSSTYTYSNGQINYWFGVTIELDFYLPNDTGTTGGNQINGDDMVFEFKGDDDVWVFVDDELVLDLGGIHSTVDGTIDFSTGEITIKNDAGTTLKTTTMSTIAAGSHKLTFYYMERGASASNMLISFNTIPEWKYQSSSVGTMKVTKTWDDDDDDNRPSSILVGLFDKVATYTSGSSSYTVDGTTYTFEDGYSYDSTGYVNAYVSNGNIYVRVDTQELSASNNWTYTWKLLDSSKSEYYQILELTTLENYTTTSSHTAITTYDTYWTVVGYDTLNGTVTVNGEGKNAELVSYTGILDDGLQIVLTDGSQQGVASTTGFPTTYSGYVIDVSDDTLVNTEVAFSQKATEDTTNTGSYVYGVTTDISTTAIWTVEMAGGCNSFTVNGQTVYAPTFYLKDSQGRYLAITQTNEIASSYILTLVSDKAQATAFSYNTLGELNTADSPGLQIVIEDGKYSLVTGRYGNTDERNVKIYIPTTATVGSHYTITNTVLPSVTLTKVDFGDEDTTLSDVTFEMYQKNDNGDITTYYSFDDTNGVVAWSATAVEQTTDADGEIIYKYLPDGTYYLKETGAADGYNCLSDELWFTVSGGKITAVSDSNYISIDTTDSNALTIIVRNDPGVELPYSGALITSRTYVFAGGIVVIAAALLLYRRRRKARAAIRR